MNAESNEGEQRRRLSSYDFGQVRKRRRRFVVPQTADDFHALEDAYHPVGKGFRGNDGEDRENDSIFSTSVSSSQRSGCRLLPSTQVLTSMKNVTPGMNTKPPETKNSMLLHRFYESIGMKVHPSFVRGSADTNTEEDILIEKNRAQQVIDEIDDSSRSTMKSGHHRRYLQLMTHHSMPQRKSRLNFAQRKEFSKLHQMVLKEQASYRLSLEAFHVRYKSRYLVGFESVSSNEDGALKRSVTSAFCRWACSQAQSINREWKKSFAVDVDSSSQNYGDDRKNASDCTKNYADVNPPMPKWYGKVRQTLALHSRPTALPLDIQDLAFSVVYESAPASQSSFPSPTSASMLTNVSDIPNGVIGRRIPPPTMDIAPTVQLLRHDPKILEIATKYSATIATTSDTLETLLQLPGDHSSKWMLPCSTKVVSSSTCVTILDLPIAQAFSSPRSCLERGLQEGLYQFLPSQQQLFEDDESSDETQNKKEKRDGHCHPPSQFFYSIWTLPTRSSYKKPTRVIIRTLVRLKDSVSRLPLRLRVHAEYFSSSVHNQDDSRGTGNPRSRREIPNSYERSLWVLDQVLFGHQASCLLCRIDPTTCTILGWDTTSIAQAFAESAPARIPKGSESYRSAPGPLDHWKSLIQLLQSIPSIDRHDTLLCLPGLIFERKNPVNDNGRDYIMEEGTINTTDTPSQLQQQQVRFDPFSVSVHASMDASLVSDAMQSREDNISPLSSLSYSNIGTICLNNRVLDQANSVVLGDKALRDCRRDWEWERPNQVPNTYPVADTIE